MGIDSGLLGSVLEGLGRGARTVSQRATENRRISDRDKRQDDKDSQKRKDKTDAIDRASDASAMKAQAEQIKEDKKTRADEKKAKAKDRKDLKASELKAHNRAVDLEADKIKDDKADRAKKEQAVKDSNSFDSRYDRWLQGKYKPTTTQEANAFRKKSSPSGKTKEEKIPVSKKTSADAWDDYLNLSAPTRDLFNDFDDYVAKTEKATGQKFRTSADPAPTDDQGGPPASGDGSQGQPADSSISQPGATLDFPFGYNSHIRGDFLPQIENPADTIPAEFPPDVNAPIQDAPGNQAQPTQLLSPRKDDPNFIDVTDEVDPTFKHDPARNPDAARADALFDRPENTWTKSDKDFIEEYLEALGI